VLDGGKERAAEVLCCGVDEVVIAKLTLGSETFFVFGDSVQHILGLDINMVLNTNEDFAADSIPVMVGKIKAGNYYDDFIEFFESGPCDCRKEREWNEAQKHTRLAELERKVALLIEVNTELAASEKKLEEALRSKLSCLEGPKGPKYVQLTPKEIEERHSFEYTRENINEHYQAAIDRENGVSENSFYGPVLITTDK
jgi:hypothetical protein